MGEDNGEGRQLSIKHNDTHETIIYPLIYIHLKLKNHIDICTGIISRLCAYSVVGWKVCSEAANTQADSPAIMGIAVFPRSLRLPCTLSLTPSASLHTLTHTIGFKTTKSVLNPRLSLHFIPWSARADQIFSAAYRIVSWAMPPNL